MIRKGTITTMKEHELVMTTIDEKYELARLYVKSLMNSERVSLIFLGKQGQGKSFLINEVLTDDGVNYAVKTGFTTPLGLYNFLYANKDRQAIVLDDLGGMFNNLTSVSILLPALYCASGKNREISYNTSKEIGIPNSFTLNAKVILITNKLPKSISADLIKSRCLVVEFDYTYKELLAIMGSIADTERKGLTKDERKMIVDFIAQNSDVNTPNFDLRVQGKIEDVYLADKVNWDKLAFSILGTDYRVVLMKKIMQNNKISVQEQADEWCRQTRMGRSSFFELKKKVQKSGGISYLCVQNTENHVAAT